MKREYLQILVHIGSLTRKERKLLGTSGKTLHKKDVLGGMTAYGVHSKTRERIYRVYLNGKVVDSEFIDAFYHEITHVLLHIMRLKINRGRGEHLCRWVGYLGKVMWCGGLPASLVMEKKFSRKAVKGKDK